MKQIEIDRMVGSTLYAYILHHERFATETELFMKQIDSSRHAPFEMAVGTLDEISGMLEDIAGLAFLGMINHRDAMAFGQYLNRLAILVNRSLRKYIFV